MTDLQKRKEIVSLMTFLQRFIQNHVDQSFTDLTFDLETLVRDYLNIFEKDNEQYSNLNGIKHNYPAIDLENKSKNIAIQVTTNADSVKVKKTIDTYNKHNLTYAKLIIIGFIKATKSNPPNVEVYGEEYLIKLAKHGTTQQLDKAYEVLKRKIPWHILTPLDDRDCFDVVFDVINRSAVRDYSICEGDFDKMVDGLFEVKEIITTGNIKAKNIRAKALVEYTDAIKRQLSEIEFYTSEIIQICNHNKNSRNQSFLCLSGNERDKIDDAKQKIISKTNELAKEMKLNKSIVGSRRY